jgi:uncharacterized membrane protein YdjX (TVP38/TMEM64 family)
LFPNDPITFFTGGTVRLESSVNDSEISQPGIKKPRALINGKWFLLLAVVLVSLVFVMGYGEYLTDPQLYQDQFEQEPVRTALIFILAFVLSTAFLLPVTGAFIVASGVIFGTLWGTPIALFSFTAGGSCGFMLSRYLLRDLVQHRYASHLKAVNEGVEQSGVYYLMSMRMIPIIPFWLVNVLMGLTPLPFNRFLFATFVGMLPVTIAITNVGSHLGSVESFEVAEIFTPGLIISLTFLAMLPLVLRFFVRYFEKRRK